MPAAQSTQPSISNFFSNPKPKEAVNAQEANAVAQAEGAVAHQANNKAQRPLLASQTSSQSGNAKVAKNGVPDEAASDGPCGPPSSREERVKVKDSTPRKKTLLTESKSANANVCNNDSNKAIAAAKKPESHSRLSLPAPSPAPAPAPARTPVSCEPHQNLQRTTPVSCEPDQKPNPPLSLALSDSSPHSPCNGESVADVNRNRPECINWQNAAHRLCLCA